MGTLATFGQRVSAEPGAARAGGGEAPARELLLVSGGTVLTMDAGGTVIERRILKSGMGISEGSEDTG